MNISPLVSIIIPVYNIEKFIAKCLESLVSQTYKNIEIIIVNDGSTDKSPSICRSYAAKDNRIKLINQKNQGLSGARNTGIQHITGDLVLFVDGDDWLDDNCCEVLVKEQKENNSDLIIFPYVREYRDKSYKRKLFTKDVLTFSDYEYKEFYRRLVGPVEEELKNPSEIDIYSTVWGKLYKKDLLENKFVDTKKIGTEDLLFNIMNLINARRVKYTSSTYYHYNKTNDISLTKKFNIQSYERKKQLIAEIENFLIRNDIDKKYQEALKNRKILSIFPFIYMICNSTLNRTEKIKNITYIVEDQINSKEYEKFAGNIKYISNSWKVFYFLLINKKSKPIFILVETVTKLWRIKNEKGSVFNTLFRKV
ncbi:glycosyltransferase [Enterococcus faecium]|nr:glycosyltransferase [Enterococcus faecium]